MMRTRTVILIAVGIASMVAASGCSESKEHIVSPGNGDGSTPCDGYEPGVVVVVFDEDAPLPDIDNYVRNVGLGFEYITKGQVWVVADAVSGDAVETQERVAASLLVDRVTLAHRTYPDNVSFLVIRFAVGVVLDDALAFVASYPELATTRYRRDWVMVHFVVVQGDEDEWIDYFLQEDLVLYSEKAWFACPTVE